MSRTPLILMLLVAVLTGSLPGSSLLSSVDGQTLSSLAEIQKARRHIRRDIRQERADAQAEVLFWFRTHPTQRVFPQTEVDRMLQSGGYTPVALKSLTGSHNPFFTEACP